MKIDFAKIVTNSLSALVAAVFVGAAAIVWNAATSIDQRIENANEDILEQQTELKATQDVLKPEITEIRIRVSGIEDQLRSLNKILSEIPGAKDKITFDPKKPFVIDSLKNLKKPEEWKMKELSRIGKEINTRQQEIMSSRK